MVKTWLDLNYLPILFKLKQYQYIVLLFSCIISIFLTHVVFSLNKGENWFAALTDIAILKTQNHIGGKWSCDRIFSSEDMENILLCISVSYSLLYNKYRKLHGSRSIYKKSHACLTKCL